MKSELDSYFKSVGSRPLLTREQEIILAKKIENQKILQTIFIIIIFFMMMKMF